MNKEEFINEINELGTTKEKGDYFLKTLGEEFFPDEDICYLDGSGDGGIDAYFTGDNNWSIIQSKYGSSYRGVDSICSEFSKIFVHLEEDGYTGKDNTFIYFRDFVKDNTENKTINLYLLTCEKINASELSAFKSIKTIFSERYNINFEVENLYIDLLSERELKEKVYEFELPGNFIKDDGSGKLVGKVKARDLYNLMKSYESLSGDIKLFYKSNIRLYLSNKLSKEITETISKEPDKFFERNNGITILTNGIKYNDTQDLILCNPDCINGCQTSQNIYRYISKSGIVPNADICITIIDVSKLTKEDKLKITECRNKQTAVKAVGSVFVLDDKVKEIKNILLSEYGKILQIKKGEFTPKKIDFVDLLSICFCTSGDPGTAKLKSAVDYNSKTGIEYLTKLHDDKTFLYLCYRLAEICEDINKKSHKYHIDSLRHTQISVLYAILEKVTGKENYTAMLKIIANYDLLDYFIRSSTSRVKIYTDIDRAKPKFKQDYDTDNMERLSKILKLEKAEGLVDCISSWYEDIYKPDSDIVAKVNSVLCS